MPGLIPGDAGAVALEDPGPVEIAGHAAVGIGPRSERHPAKDDFVKAQEPGQLDRAPGGSALPARLAPPIIDPRRRVRSRSLFGFAFRRRRMDAEAAWS